MHPLDFLKQSLTDLGGSPTQLAWVIMEAASVSASSALEFQACASVLGSFTWLTTLGSEGTSLAESFSQTWHALTHVPSDHLAVAQTLPGNQDGPAYCP